MLAVVFGGLVRRRGTRSSHVAGIFRKDSSSARPGVDVTACSSITSEVCMCICGAIAVPPSARKASHAFDSISTQLLAQLIIEPLYLQVPPRKSPLRLVIASWPPGSTRDNVVCPRLGRRILVLARVFDQFHHHGLRLRFTVKHGNLEERPKRRTRSVTHITGRRNLSNEEMRD